ncbi:ribonuclease HII [Thermoanaerobacterium thermosaccharolyticum]|uniref:Ribonuclease HII n=1 Tax=Thermoanaerobacterium thermosaccharolyticum TaxID=1517 RepID=A0A231VH23_THETR|nr:ribonuclease HII [Thermoanaerobacterium thermosaccharolyticum]OXT07485.1 ribonuclease HII [Thermoanaerobacterium thermosaccharolyticum]PHO07779.1 ribonuclease HII [Thermoanaerobacterium thermosaccharolyticum]
MSQQSLNIKSLKEYIYNYGLNIDGLKLNDNALKWFDKERLRIENLTQYERELYKLNYKAIGGVDEVGRGPLAGPVVAGCVVLPKDVFIPDVNDSKKLGEEKRELLSEVIKKNAIAYGIGIIDNEYIDSVNILNSTYEAMRIAISKIDVEIDCLLIDAVKIPNIDIMQKPIIKGDMKSISIAAASIIAKVERDNLMKKYDELYPQYGFKKNKGYGTKEHIEAIKKYGPCPIHRKTFLKKIIGESNI